MVWSWQPTFTKETLKNYIFDIYIYIYMNEVQIMCYNKPNMGIYMRLNSRLINNALITVNWQLVVQVQYFACTLNRIELGPWLLD